MSCRSAGLDSTSSEKRPRAVIFGSTFETLAPVAPRLIPSRTSSVIAWREATKTAPLMTAAARGSLAEVAIIEPSGPAALRPVAQACWLRRGRWHLQERPRVACDNTREAALLVVRQSPTGCCHQSDRRSVKPQARMVYDRRGAGFAADLNCDDHVIELLGRRPFFTHVSHVARVNCDQI